MSRNFGNPMDPDELLEDWNDPADELYPCPIIVRRLTRYDIPALDEEKKRHENPSGQIDAVRASMRRKLGFENEDFTPADLGAALMQAVEGGINFTAAEWRVATGCFIDEKLYIKKMRLMQARVQAQVRVQSLRN